MKKYFIILLILSLMFIVGCNTLPTGNVINQKPLDEISVRLPIPFYDASFTPFYAAIDQGYYAKEGLDVSFELGNSETNPVKMVAIGANEFGILGGPDTLLVAKSRNVDLVAVAILQQNSNFPGLVTLKSSNLTKLSDLNGKRIGFFYGHISTDVIHSMLAKENITYKEIDVGSDYNQLITGMVDAQWVFRTTGIINLEDKGMDVNFISPKDYGMTVHGYTIFVSRAYLNKNPEIIERFLRATFKGIKYSMQNPEDATNSLIARDQNLRFDLELKRWLLFSEPMSGDFPIGYLNNTMFNETYSRLESLGVLEKSFDYKTSYTTEFVKKINLK